MIELESKHLDFGYTQVLNVWDKNGLVLDSMLCTSIPHSTLFLPAMCPGGSPLCIVSPMLLPSSCFLIGSLANWRYQQEITRRDKRCGVFLLLWLSSSMIIAFNKFCQLLSPFVPSSLGLITASSFCQFLEASLSSVGSLDSIYTSAY